MDWSKEIKRSEFIIKRERVNIMIYKLWNASHEYYSQNGYFPTWEARQKETLDKLWTYYHNIIHPKNK